MPIETIRGLAAMDQTIAAYRNGLKECLKTDEDCQRLHDEVQDMLKDALNSEDRMEIEIALLLKIGFLNFAQFMATEVFE